MFLGKQSIVLIIVLKIGGLFFVCLMIFLMFPWGSVRNKSIFLIDTPKLMIHFLYTVTLHVVRSNAKKENSTTIIAICYIIAGFWLTDKMNHLCNVNESFVRQSGKEKLFSFRTVLQ